MSVGSVAFVIIRAAFEIIRPTAKVQGIVQFKRRYYNLIMLEL